MDPAAKPSGVPFSQAKEDETGMFQETNCVVGLVDTSPINVVDITALHKLAELRDELEGQGIRLLFVRVKRSLLNFFNASWLNQQAAPNKAFWSMTVAAAVDLFEHRQRHNGQTGLSGVAAAATPPA